MEKDIINQFGEKVGTLSLPDETPEDVWESVLNEYKKPLPDETKTQRSFLIKERKQFADDMMERFKARNMELGMNIAQALWLHHRTRSWNVTLPPQFGGFSYTLDILNMAVSGDLETAYFSVRFGQLDDMTKPYHCVNQSMIDWLKKELSDYLGFNLG